MQKEAENDKIDIQIDELTDCLKDRKTGKLYQTTYQKATREDIKQTNRWDKKSFNWELQQNKSDNIISLKKENGNVVEGLLGITYKPQDSAVLVDLVESNPKNIGRNGELIGVGPHLFAIAIKKAKEANFDAVYFTPKTKLINHYSITLGAVVIGSNMIIEGSSFENLYQKYFGGNNDGK